MPEEVIPLWEKRARNRLTEVLPRVRKGAAELRREPNPTEASTRTVVSDLLRDGFGFDGTELGQEFDVRSDRADFALKIKKKGHESVVAFVEVKRFKIPLREKHLDQVEKYARHYGAPWAILTNAQTWELYHVDDGIPSTMTLVESIDLLDGARVKTQVSRFLPMTREGLQRGIAESTWRTEYALSERTLTRVVLSDRVIGAMVTELWRDARYRATPEEIKWALAERVLPPE
jgi:hypothetical protein